MSRFKSGEKAFIVESNRFVKEVVIKVALVGFILLNFLILKVK